MALLADGSSASPNPFVPGHVEPGATVFTDAWMGYRGLARLGYVRQRRSQRAARGRGGDPGELLPAVHRVASLAKRWLLSTHLGSVEEEHLQSYLDEFVSRFSRRRSPSGLGLLPAARAGHRPQSGARRNIVAGKQPREIPQTPPATSGHPPCPPPLLSIAATTPWSHEEDRQVDAHDQLVIADRVVRDRLAIEDPRVVHQRVDAPEALQRPNDDTVGRRGLEMSPPPSGRPGRRMA